MTERRPPVFGSEPWRTIAGVEWCHFDWWFSLVITTDFNGEVDAFQARLESTLRSPLHRRRDTRAKLSHLADLRCRLGAAGLGVEDLAAADEPDKRLLTKARRKVLEQELDGRAMTDAMRDTPARRLEQRARFGYWDRFPTNPDRFYERLAGRRTDTFVPKGRSFNVTRSLRDRLAKLDGPRRTPPDRLALYRAFHTVGLELADRADDSYGVIGEMRLDAFTTYLAIDWAAAGMAPDDYWQDLCELLVCETHALTYQHDTLPFHRRPGRAGRAHRDHPGQPRRRLPVRIRGLRGRRGPPARGLAPHRRTPLHPLRRCSPPARLRSLAADRRTR